MWEHLGVAIAAGAFLLHFLVTIIGGIWKLSQMEISLRGAIDASGKEIDERIDQQARQFGETASALRAKITEVEIWARDNFVRRDSFYKVTGDLSADIKDMGKDITARLDRMEGKIDEKPDR